MLLNKGNEMISKSTLAVALVASMTVNIVAAVVINTREPKTEYKNSNVQALQMKSVDDDIFNIYRKGLNLAADAVECDGESECLDKVSDELEALQTPLGDKHKQRRDLVTQYGL